VPPALLCFAAKATVSYRAVSHFSRSVIRSCCEPPAAAVGCIDVAAAAAAAFVCSRVHLLLRCAIDARAAECLAPLAAPRARGFGRQAAAMHALVALLRAAAPALAVVAAADLLAAGVAHDLQVMLLWLCTRVSVCLKFVWRDCACARAHRSHAPVRHWHLLV
jgi:hypothetical protein